jgi:hypothetical protein
VLLEGKNQKLRNAGPAHGLAVGMGGSGGSNAVSSGGAGGGRGY